MNSILALSLTEIRDQIKAKKLSSSEVVDYYTTRSKNLNDKLNAYVTVLDMNPAGIPLAMKDNVCTKGIKTTASAKLLDTFIAPYESTVSTRLLTAGFGWLGKTNMDAWAHGSSTETSDYGPSRNPWDTDKAPGGSSGGSAVAVSAGMAPAAIGTETAGSIRQPSAWCGVVGYKPTYGRVSRYGIIAMGSSLDSPGPITRTVADAAYLLQHIAGHDPYDATSSALPVPDYTAAMKKGEKMKIGIAETYFNGVDEQVRVKVEDMIKMLEKLGHTIVKVSMMDPKYAISDYTILQRAEVSSNLARYDGVRYGHGRDAFSTEAKRRIMLGTYVLAHGYYDEYYKKAQKVRSLIIDDFHQAFSQVDVLLAPTTPTTAFKLGEFEKYPFFGEVMDVLLEPAAMAGLPAVSLPCGLDRDSMPIGMQLMAPRFVEESLFDIAYQIEQETKFFGIVEKGLSNWE